jgi:hypothetical protein
MDSSEYKIINTNYSSEDLEKINLFNQTHINLAKCLLKFNKEKMFNDSYYSKLDISDKIKYIHNEEKYKLFCRTYPIVSKYIIAFGLFSTKAFTKYLNWKNTIRPSDNYRNELIQNQRKQELWKNKYIYSIYVKYLYQEKHPHTNLSDINKIYQESIDLLNIETNEFFDKYEEELSKIEDTKKEYTIERKNKIKEQLKIKLENNLKSN